MTRDQRRSVDVSDLTGELAASFWLATWRLLVTYARVEELTCSLSTIAPLFRKARQNPEDSSEPESTTGSEWTESDQNVGVATHRDYSFFSTSTASGNWVLYG